jgi:hypothetical protein
MPTSLLSGTAGEAQVRAALAALAEQERAAVMLRDAYDLPPQAVAVALARDLDSTDHLVAAGRLRLGAAYDDRALPELTGHTGRTPADLGMLGRLADGSLPPQRSVALRRHLGACPSCEEVVELLARARRLVAALPVLAMPDDARESMIERVAVRAATVLPSVDEVLLAIETDEETRPAISPVVVIFAIVLALVLGVAVAAATSLESSGQRAAAGTTPTVAPETPAFSVPPTHVTKTKKAKAQQSQTATPSRTAVSASASATPTLSSARPHAAAAITISPTSGPRGTAVVVTGTGWEPLVPVAVRYVGTLASSTASATPNRHGRFVVRVRANGALPGDYRVTADNGSQSASESFSQTS